MASNQRFTRSSWAVLAVVAGLNLLAVYAVAVRLTLPTDGWVVATDVTTGEEVEHQIFYDNVLQGPTPLQVGDRLYALNGQPFSDPIFFPRTAAAELRADWEAGRPLRYTILREGQTLILDVPPKRWTLAAVLQLTFGTLHDAVDSLTNPILLGIALLTFWKRPGDLSARALLLFCTSIFINNLSTIIPDGVSVILDAPAYYLTSFFSYVIYAVLLAPSLLLFALTFPRPKKIVERWPGLLLAPFGVGLVVAVAIYVANAALAGWLATMLMFILSLASLVHSGFTARDAISRAQMRWAVGGLGLGLAFSLLTFPAAFGLVDDSLGELFGSGISIGFFIISLSLSVAVLRYRLYDIDLIIRRTLVYTMLTAALALVYFGSVVVLETTFRAFTGGAAQSQLAIVASTLTIAALFSPLRGRVQNFIDRRFFRRKYDAAQTLAQFAAAARDETDLDELTGHLVSVVGQTMQPASVSLWLAERRTARPAGSEGQER